MTTTMPSRQAIENAGDLDFTPRGEKQADIQIEIRPDGLHVQVRYQGAISSIPAAIQRLRAAGIPEMVSASRLPTPTPSAAPRKAAERVEPIYQPDGTACCPVHKRPLTEGQYGLFCKSKAQPGEVQNDKNYCSLKFSE